MPFSKVPLGTASRLAAELNAAAPASGAIEVAWNPEFIREGPTALDPAETTAAARGCLLIDACQAVNPMRWRAMGWQVAAPFPTSRSSSRTYAAFSHHSRFSPQLANPTRHVAR